MRGLASPHPILGAISCEPLVSGSPFGDALAALGAYAEVTGYHCASSSSAALEATPVSVCCWRKLV